MHHRLRHSHQGPQGYIGFDIGCADLVSAAIQAGEKHQIEHGIKQETHAQQHEIAVHAHGVVFAGLYPGRQQAEKRRYHHRQKLDEHCENHGSLYRIPFADGQQGGIIDILLLPHVQESEKQPQGHIEKCHGIGIIRDQDHGAKQAENQGHRVAQQAELLI